MLTNSHDFCFLLQEVASCRARLVDAIITHLTIDMQYFLPTLDTCLM